MRNTFIPVSELEGKVGQADVKKDLDGMVGLGACALEPSRR